MYIEIAEQWQMNWLVGSAPGKNTIITLEMRKLTY